jgi:hypothetical protein
MMVSVKAFNPPGPWQDENIKRAIGKKIVLEVSSVLPKVDSIGHKVLHANNEFIANVLALDDNVPHDAKKQIILFSIKMAQYGDDMGSVLLQQYYDMVDKFI